MSQTDDAMNEFMLGFIHGIDEKVQEPGNEKVLEYWKEGNFEECYDWLKQTYPELTEDQFTWLEEFLSEI